MLKSSFFSNRNIQSWLELKRVVRKFYQIMYIYCGLVTFYLKNI